MCWDWFNCEWPVNIPVARLSVCALEALFATMRYINLHLHSLSRSLVLLFQCPRIINCTCQFVSMFWPPSRQQWSLLNRFRTEQGHCGACRRKWRLTDTDLCPCGETQTRRCLTLSNPVPWQNWMVAYLGYTLRMKTRFRGWPVMGHYTHTRRRRMLC